MTVTRWCLFVSRYPELIRAPTNRRHRQTYSAKPEVDTTYRKWIRPTGSGYDLPEVDITYRKWIDPPEVDTTYLVSASGRLALMFAGRVQMTAVSV